MAEKNEAHIEQGFVSYYTHEAAIARMDCVNRRLWVLCIVVFLALMATNAAWIYRESQYEDVVTTVTQETEAESGGNAVIYGQNAGAVIYGESTADGYDAR